MAKENQEKTVFITSQGLYYYKVMPFRLKNVGVTYQKLINKTFSKQIGRNMEVYVENMLIKSKEESTHLDDLQETFATLRQYQMKLNPNKCAFGVAFPEVLPERNKSEPREGMSHTRDGVAQDSERSPEAHRKNSSA